MPLFLWLEFVLLSGMFVGLLRELKSAALPFDVDLLAILLFQGE